MRPNRQKIWLIAKHELRLMTRDKTLLLVGALLAGLMIYGALNGATWIEFQKKTIAAAKQDEEKRLSGMQEELRQIEAGTAKPKMFRDPARPGWVGRFLGERYALLEPAPLAALSIGQRDLYPFYFRVSTMSAQDFIYKDEIENPFNLLTGRFDAAFVIIYLLPLVILAVSYNLLSSEKEAGTLQITLAQAVKTSDIVWGKIAARAAFINALMILLSLVGAAINRVDFFDGETLLRLNLWSAAIVIYSGFWFALAAFVNLRGASSAANATVLAGAWLFLVVIIPAFLTVFVSQVYPAGSRLEFVNAERRQRAKYTAQNHELLENYYLENPEHRPEKPITDDFLPGWHAAQKLRDKTNLPLLLGYEERLTAQNALADKLRFLSPSLAMQSVLNDLAATDFERQQSFFRQVIEFHHQWQDYFLPKIFRGERLKSTDYNNFPEFEFREQPLSQTVNRVLLSFGMILLTSFGVVFFARRTLKNYAPVG